MKRLSSTKPLILLLLVTIIAATPFLLSISINSSHKKVTYILAEPVELGDIARLIVDEDEVELIYADGSSTLVAMYPHETLASIIYNYGLTRDDLASAVIQGEMARSISFDQGVFIGSIAVSVAGLLVGAFFLKPQLGKQTHNPA